MPFQEEFSEFLDIEGGFASDAVVIPASGDMYGVRGIFSAEYVDVEDGFTSVSGNNPCFECAEKDVMEISYNDILRINAKDYRVKNIKPDSYGWVVLVLESQ